MWYSDSALSKNILPHCCQYQNLDPVSAIRVTFLTLGKGLIWDATVESYKANGAYGPTSGEEHFDWILCMDRKTYPHR